MPFDAFLKLDGIDDDSTDSKHQKWIECLSYSFSASNASGGPQSHAGASGGQRVDLADLSIVKRLSTSSPDLFLHCCKGQNIPTATLVLCRAMGDKQKYMEYKLEKVRITGVRPGGASQGGDSVPLEELSLTFAKITETYTTTKADGTPGGDVVKWWNAEDNTGG